jgi:cell division transport system permease protein
MKVWLSHHQKAALLAIHRLTATPANSLLSVLAIGVALALPAGGQMLLANALSLAGTNSAAPQISIFMAGNADRKMAAEVESRLKKRGDLKRVQFLPREETLARMKANPGLRDVIEALPANPFPDAFVVSAADEGPEAMERLTVEFRQLPRVEHVQLDSAWVRRLDALLQLGRTAVLVLGVLLGAGLISISFSIIRMQVLTQRTEIEVSRLLGATDGFIQRPFLYFGLLLGLGGGVVAWLLVGAATLWLRAPLGELVRLYDLTLVLHSLDMRDSALLLGFASTFGWLGALISLKSHLRHD